MSGNFSIPITEFCHAVITIPPDARGKWLTDLAEALRDNDPSRHPFAAYLLSRRPA